MPTPGRVLVMMHVATIDDQLVLHDAAALCGYLMLRPGKLKDEEEPPIVGEEIDQAVIFARLKSALDLAWPDHTEQPEAIAPFLESATARFQAKAREMSGAEGFVPAAQVLTSISRDLVFEHLKQELTDVLGGIESEDFWDAFDTLEATASIKHLTRAGLLIKLRSLGSFLVGAPNKFDDEIAAEEFFPAGRWEEVRDERISSGVAAYNRIINKGFAHLTLTRPLPEDRDIHRPGSYRPSLDELVQLFEQFTENVDPRLLPEWWRDWFAGFAEGSRTN
jgi:hypothetical protein